MGKNEIYNKRNRILGETDKSIDYKKINQDNIEKWIEKIKEYPPVLMRLIGEHLIKFNGDKEEPKLIWNEEVLSSITNLGELIQILTLLENQNESRTRKY